MSVRIKWLNRNTDYDSITIYRDTKPISQSALPASIAVLTDGETDYLDTTAPTKTLLYYLIALKKGTAITYSLPKPTVNIGYTGPGPQTIRQGDWRFGYFGPVTTAELFTTAELCSLCGVASPASVTGFTWHKFAFNGKILFFSNAHVSAAVGWNLLYSKGLVFGVDGDGPTGHSNPPVNQMKRVAKGDDLFIVRLVRSNNTPGYVQGTQDVTNGVDVAEYALIHGIRKSTTGAANPLLGDITALMPVVATQAPAAEFQAGALTQGCNHAGASQWGMNVTNPLNCPRNGTTHAWRPILEYVIP